MTAKRCALIIFTILAFFVVLGLCLSPTYAPPVRAEGTDLAQACEEDSLVLMSTDTTPVPLLYFWVPTGTPDFVKWQISTVGGKYDSVDAVILQVVFKKGDQYWSLGMVGIKGAPDVNILWGPLYLVTATKDGNGDYIGTRFWLYERPDTCPIPASEAMVAAWIQQVIKNLGG